MRLAVTGTDTGVGKTVVAAAILAWLTTRGRRVAGMKPIETGVVPGDPGDAGVLRGASAAGLTLDGISPYRFGEPVAPLVAAAHEGCALDLPVLDRAFDRLVAAHDDVVVEGAGGLLVPIAPGEDYATLFARWRCEVVLVAANRLGVLNHAQLTVRAAEAAGLSIRGIVLKEIANPRIRSIAPAEASNLDLLRTLLAPRPVVRFPWLDDPSPRVRGAGATLAGAAIGVLFPELRPLS